MVWYDKIWYDMIWYNMIWYDMIRYEMIWYDMIWYDMIWYLIFNLTSGMFDCSNQQRLRDDRIDRYHPLCIITQNRYVEFSFFDICDEILFIFIIISLFIKASLFAPLLCTHLSSCLSFLLLFRFFSSTVSETILPLLLLFLFFSVSSPLIALLI